MPDKARPTDHPYHKDQFIYDEETDSYTCPHRQTLAFTGIKSARKKSRIYRVASGAICRGCPAFGTCTKNGRYGRSVEIGLHDVALRRHREWMATDEAKQLYVRRLPLVEPLFASSRTARRAAIQAAGHANQGRMDSPLVTAFNLRTLWRVWRIRIEARSAFA